MKKFDLSSIKAIATDLDGTALNKQHVLDPVTVRVLDKLVDKGYKVMIATGRHYEDALGICADHFRHEIPLVTSNGSMLNRTGEQDSEINFIPKAVIDRLLQYEVPDYMLVCAYTPDAWYMSQPNERIASFYEQNRFMYQVADISKLPRDQIIKFFWIDPTTTNDPDDSSEFLNALQPQLIAEFGDSIECVFSAISTLEVNSAGVSKEGTIARYLSNFGLTVQDNLICFGDGMNDELMLGEAKLGFIMGNADPRLVAAIADKANCVQVGNHNELMVARILNQLFALGEDIPPYFEFED